MALDRGIRIEQLLFAGCPARDALQNPEHFLGTGGALGDRGLEHGKDELVHERIYRPRGQNLTRRSGGLLRLRPGQGQEIQRRRVEGCGLDRIAVGRMPGQHLIEDGTEGVDIRTLVDQFRLADELLVG